MPIGARSKTSSKSLARGCGAEQVGVPARGDVQHDRDAAGDRPPRRRCRRSAQRADVDHQAVALARPSRSRASASRRRAPSGTAARSPPTAPPGRRPPTGSPCAQLLGVAEPLERLAGGEHEAQVAVEGEDQRLGQLAQRGRGRAVGACADPVGLRRRLGEVRHTTDIGRRRPCLERRCGPGGRLWARSCTHRAACLRGRVSQQ